ncbi:MAG: CPBP family intramembrane metalloprotease [Bacteroidetes bacterium]|nr:CPBP family intramembrane metalloprotease [Bacteroidota bacterium]
MKRFEKHFSLPALFSEENKKSAVILLIAPVVLTTWKYYGTKTFYLAHLSDLFVISGSAAMTAEWYNYFSAFVLLGLTSVAVIKLIFKESLADYGLRIGDWKFWLPAALLIGIVMVGLSYLSSKNPQYIAEYPLYKGAGDSLMQFIIHAFAYLVFYISWEFYFRGFMQTGLMTRFGVWGAILVQVAISCIVHIGKPDSEIYSSIIGALLWGILVYRSKSIWPAVATHWLLGISLDFFICFG